MGLYSSNFSTSGFTCESEYSIPRSVYIINAVLNGLFSIPTMVCNILLLVAIWRTPPLRTPSNVLICALASTDCCVGLIQSIYVAFLCSNLEDIMPSSEKCILFKINKTLAPLFAQTSFLVFTAISIDKLVMLYYSLTYFSMVTNKRVYIVLAGVFTVSVLLSALNSVDMVTYGLIVVILDFICITISLLSYVKIYRTVLRHQREIHTQECATASSESNKKKRLLDLVRFKKRTQSMMVLYSAFLLSYVPFLSVVISIGMMGNQLHLAVAMVFAITAVFLNSLLSPLLICWTLRDIRQAVISLLFAVQRVDE